MISIIIPIYNSERYLARCIDSVLVQTFSDWELILVDDGSKDGSANICRKYEEDDSRIRYVFKDNGGVSSARNRGLRYAQGDYVLFIDSDDSIAENTLERVLDKASEHDFDCIVWGFNQNGNLWIPKEEKDFLDISDFKKDFAVYLNNLLCSPCNKLFKRSLIKEKFNENITHAEDFIFFLKYLKNCRNISFIKDALYNYDISVVGSLTHSFNSSNLYALELMQKEVINYYGADEDPAIFRKYVYDVLTQVRLLYKDISVSFSSKKKILKNWIKDSYFKSLTSSAYGLNLKERALFVLAKIHCWNMLYFLFKY